MSTTSSITLTTDLSDYQPGDTALITAEGVAVGSTLAFQVQHVIEPGADEIYGTADDLVVDLGGAGHSVWYVTDGGEGDLDGLANGTILTSWYVDPDDSAGATFLLSAEGEGQVGYATFTDAPEANPGTFYGLLAVDASQLIEDVYFTNDIYGAGTGNIKPFLRIQANGTEHGYNSDNNNHEFDAKGGPWTHALNMIDVPVIFFDPTDPDNLFSANKANYREFQLDINENNNAALDQYLSLNALQIYLTLDPLLNGFTPPPGEGAAYPGGVIPAGQVGGGFASGAVMLYDMDRDPGADGLFGTADDLFVNKWVGLNYALNPGSGVGDLAIYLPDEMFQTALEQLAVMTGSGPINPNTTPVYVVLYSAMGQSPDGAGGVTGAKWSSSDGFEEWSVIDYYRLRGMKYLDSNGNGTLDLGETGLEGWTINVWSDVNANGLIDAGTDVLIGQAVTDEFGFWEVNLRTGGRVIIEEVMQGGWTQTGPGGNGTYVLNVAGDVNNLNFGNVQYARLSGYKYEDTDGDGLLDAGEPGLSGWTINLYKDGAFVASTVTGAGGYYEFVDLAPGNYTTSEVLQNGWVQTAGSSPETLTAGENDTTGNDFLNFKKFSISGTKYEDMNGDGFTTGDPGYAGVTIFIDMDGSGTLTGGDVSTTTNADGSWSLSDLGPGYIGKTVYEVVPGGAYQTLGQAGYGITGTSGADQTGLDFANTKFASLSGYKYEDVNGNGVKNAGDDGLEGWTIRLFKDGVEVASTLTGAGGYYEFTNLTPGNYSTSEDLQTGWVQTAGSSPETLTSGENDTTGNDFLNFKLFSISGTKYEDMNGDGFTTGDPGYAGVTIFIDMDGNNALSAGDVTTTTGADGSWSLTGLDWTVAGKTVYEVVPGGAYQTLGQAGYGITGTSGADQTGLDFANTKFASLSGYKYEDVNGNGVKNAGDDGLEGWTIRLFKDGVEVASTLTGAGGYYEFTNLTPGNYSTSEDLQAGWVQTAGSSPETLTSGENDTTGNDFLNFKLFDINGYKYTDITGDGLSADDTGLGGVTIFIDKDASGNLSAGDTTTTTAGDGSWSFTGLDYTYAGMKVYEVLPGGYVQTVGNAGYEITGTSGFNQTFNFANFKLFSISGTKYEDMNGDGLTAGDSGLGGVTIFIDKDGNDALSAGDLTTTTAGDGSWSFSGLDWTYDGLTVFEVLPSGFVQTLGQAGYDIVGTSGNDQTGLDFANFGLFDISGIKFIDRTGDGLSGDDTGRLGGVTIFIDENDNGEYDAGEKSTTTNDDGEWSFTGLDYSYAGMKVYEVLPNGYVQTWGTAGYTIVGTSGTDQPGLNFGNFEKFSIGGTKFLDINGDGELCECGDTGIAGVTIFIDKDGDGVLSDGDLTTTTDADGNWSFTDLDFTYAGKKVYEVVPGGYYQTIGEDGHIITGTSGTDQTGLDFANTKFASISGYKWHDLNANGAWDGRDEVDGEPGLANWLIQVYKDGDGDGLLNDAEFQLGPVQQMLTDATGFYEFTDLKAGDYIVVEMLLPGWTQTAPTDNVLDGGSPPNTESLGQGGYWVTLYSGTEAEDLNFGNRSAQGPGTRTPGFWRSPNGREFWDGIDGNESKAGQDCFADGELTYMVDSNKDGSTDTRGLLIGDWNKNGIEDGTENTIFLSLTDARKIVDASQKMAQDTRFILGRSLVASWLNYLAGNAVTMVEGVSVDGDPMSYINDAIAWMELTTTNGSGNPLSAGAGPAVRSNSAAWNSWDPSGSEIHNALDEYNNFGTINGVVYAKDGDDCMPTMADPVYSSFMSLQTTSTTDGDRSFRDIA